MNKWILLTGLFLTSSICVAETCPTVDAIKHNTITGWKAYDSEDGQPLSTARVTHFKKNVQEFALAEWANTHNKNGAIHCYYRDRTGSNLEAYLAKEHFAPKTSSDNYWYKVSGYMHCAADSEQCQFETQVLNRPQLAKS